MKTLLHFLGKTKLFWGLAVLYGLGVLLSPINRKGVNIFLSAGNQSDVLRQVSINGIIAVGMTLVILTGGIDLSVGSLLSLGTMYAAMLFTLQGWTAASASAIPLLAIVCLVLGTYLVPLASRNWARGKLRASAATPGAEGIRQALKIMNGEKVEKKITLDTLAIDKSNCEKILKENGLA